MVFLLACKRLRSAFCLSIICGLERMLNSNDRYVCGLFLELNRYDVLVNSLGASCTTIDNEGWMADIDSYN